MRENMKELKAIFKKIQFGRFTKKGANVHGAIYSRRNYFIEP